jgi:hypothetical protein
LLYDAFMAAEICTFESFTTFVETELPALYAKALVVVEENIKEEGPAVDKEEELPMKHSRSMAQA